MRRISLLLLVFWFSIPFAFAGATAEGVRSLRMAEQAMTALEEHPQWSAESGLALMAVSQVTARYDAEALFQRATAYVEQFVDAKGAIAGLEQMQDADRYAVSRFLFTAYDRTGDKRFRRAIETLYDYYDAHRDATDYVAAAPFLAQYARRFSKRPMGDVRVMLWQRLFKEMTLVGEQIASATEEERARYLYALVSLLDFAQSKEAAVGALRLALVQELPATETPLACYASLKALRKNYLRSAFEKTLLADCRPLITNTPPRKTVDIGLVAATALAAVEQEALTNADEVITPSAAAVLAFPGAEGGGRFATGGRGGKVLVVTKLTDDGSEGTLRWAVNQKYPRIVVFAVSGTIELQQQLKISSGNLTLAGQSAPAEGITIRNFGVDVNADNIIIRYLRFRMGDTKNAQSDALGGKGYRGIIIDHCSMSWSTDECASFYANRDFTMQWCILSESLTQSVHAKGMHGYGAIWGGRNATFHHNLLAHHSSRNPRLDHPIIYGEDLRLTHRGTVEVVNNVVYNWGFKPCYGGEKGWWNFMGNYYKPGAATTTKQGRFLEASINEDTGHGIGRYYLRGNRVEGVTEVLTDNWRGVVVKGDFTRADAEQRQRFAMSGGDFKVEPADKALRAVLAEAGASLYRDAIDQRIVEEVRRGATTHVGSRSGCKGLIDTQNDVGGWIDFESKAASADSDGDGMPDAWEREHGLNPADGSDAVLTTVDGGYTNIEVYLNNLVKK